MPVKRSRIGRSSSSFFNIHAPSAFPSHSPTVARPPPHAPNKVPKKSPEKFDHQVSVAQPSRPTVLTVSSPVHEDFGGVSVEENEPVSGFLESCYLCKKKLCQNADLFMYGYLQAFCTAECRDRQIYLEKEAGKLSPEPEQIGVQAQRISK